MNELLKILGSATLDGIANAISSSWIWFLNCNAFTAFCIIVLVCVVLLIFITCIEDI